MALRTILTKGDEILAKKCKPVTKFDKRLHSILDDMWETMAEANGVGLAGPQIGILKRMFIADDGETQLECINPEIISTEDEYEALEGCLSVPGVHGYVMRPRKTVIKAQNRDGEEYTFEAEGLMAQCLCHENDHLDGRLFDSKIVRYYEEEEEEGEEE